LSNKIKNAFDNVHAEEALKQSTGKYLIEKTNNYGKKYFSKAVKIGVSFACVAVITAGFAGYHMYFTPVSAISLDVNPSVELNINRFDRVVSVEAYNDEGEELVNSENLKYMDYSSALEKLMTSDNIEEYIEKGEAVSITVSVDNEKKRDEMISSISSCEYAKQKGVTCSGRNKEYWDEAHNAGLSLGKYKAYLELKELDPSVTPDDISGLTMREIHDRIQSFKGDNDQSQDIVTGNNENTCSVKGNGKCNIK